MLVAQTVSVVFAMRLSRTLAVEGPRYLNTTAVFFSEVMKLICSFLFLSHEVGEPATAAKTVLQTFRRSGVELLKVSVPSLLYTASRLYTAHEEVVGESGRARVQNNLLFISLSNLSGAVYQVTYQLKILTTAVLSMLILNKALGSTKWCALLILTTGVALIQLPRGEAKDVQKGDSVVGLAAVISACFTSGLAGVYLEKILKQTDSSIWMRNIQLAFFGGILAFIGCYVQDGKKIAENGFMQGYSGLVWAVIALQAIGGLVVAAVLKYADNILKCFGNALSIALASDPSGPVEFTCPKETSDVQWQEFKPDLLFVLGIGVPSTVLRWVSADKAKVEDEEKCSSPPNGRAGGLKTGETTDGADEVSWMQSSRLPGPSRQNVSNETRASSLFAGAEGRFLELAHHIRERSPVVLAQIASKVDGTDTTVIFLLFGAMLLCFFGLLWCFAQVAFQEIFKSEPNEAEHVVPPRSVQVPFVEPAESIKQEALPAMCPQLLSAMHAPFIVPLKPLQDSDGGWSLNIFSQNSHRVLLSATLQLRDSQRKSSCVEVRHLEKDELLGTVTSNLEVLLPDGRTYGRLLAHKGAYLLQEENGREARWSMAAEEGRISIIWLPRRGSGTRVLQDLKDGLHKLGGRPTHHRSRGTLLATAVRPEGSNGHRLEVTNISGVDPVLVLLCSLGVVTFDGILGLVEPEQFKAEKTGGAAWDPSPGLNSLPSPFSPGTSSGARA
ncbi:UDP-N-acetylglucosamine transporter (Golgi UDP-GlcNAc transporter) (Solute carrier family 35 member A3) [Durusdinium trenchii]|uniref:UDP-N-acetylglucosamine transporter (Golgi UDP-GlcNAc transporter) (Solute carrier family 35 member A3) n=1 Tax=Durusdinium trenchii TaxID=1381693 RepID=A0ABP0M6C5_9DINO